jgi:hypothetical protein
MSRVGSSILLILGLILFVGCEIFAGVVTTRVTGAANWSNISTWIQHRTGTITANTGSPIVTGTGTAFDTELSSGDILVLESSPGTVIGTVAPSLPILMRQINV